MHDPSDEQIQGLLIAIISDGFNRSLGALEAAGVVDTQRMRRHYNGVGSKYHDMVTEQIVLTARYALPAVRQLFPDDCDTTAGDQGDSTLAAKEDSYPTATDMPGRRSRPSGGSE